MKTNIAVSIPDGVSIETIIGALRQLGATATVKAAPKRKTAKAHDVRDVRFRKLVTEDQYAEAMANGDDTETEDGNFYVLGYIDGVTVARKIGRIMADLSRERGRPAEAFPSLYHSHDSAEVASKYMKQFCSWLRHVPAEYRNGVTA